MVVLLLKLDGWIVQFMKQTGMLSWKTLLLIEYLVLCHPRQSWLLLCLCDVARTRHASFAALESVHKGNDNADTNNSNIDSQSHVVVDAIDDAASSTLTRGQHARYLQLQSGSQTWNEGRRKEFHKLSK